MQHEEDGYIVISCDFCGVDWDEVIQMIEGHHGSVICLDCLKKAMDDSIEATEKYTCTMCKGEKGEGESVWRNTEAKERDGRNKHAAICWDCVRLGAKTFHKDKDVEFRWDPAKYPKK
ncbi:ClpX C4-type zinc finger protein [Poriferisphaera sp. WC338]|uniref:ClpX C4-type zinc finger protein n=1 Tax=Poriferisphaera sp. WC338 TaxID=3425129 RepID=UPI003D815B4D